MVVVRSVSGVTFTAAGSAACSCGSSALMLSTTWMTLAPGWRCTLRIDRRRGGWHPGAELGVLRAPATTVATSDSRTGAPFL